MMSDTPEIRPALSAEEWDALECDGAATREGVPVIENGHGVALTTAMGASFVVADRPHALAALCLHDHPAGFTWEDVEMLRGMVNGSSADRLPGYGVPILNLADRIAALLPPKEETP